MDLEGLANLSWREALIAIIVLLVLYVAIVYWRMRSLKRAASTSATPYAAHSAVAAYNAVQEPEQPDPAESKEALGAAEFQFPWNEPPKSEQGSGSELIEAMEREMAQLRKEVGGLRAEVLVLREELRRAAPKPGVAQQISPQYSEAMQMATQGNDAGSISEYCGISRAEAELVALVKNHDN